MEKKKKITKIISFVALGILALAGIVSAFVLNYNIYPPTAPYVIDDGAKIYISTSINENYQGYRFKFTDLRDAEIIIDSQTNTVSAQTMLDSGLAIGSEYEVSACYLGETEGSNSPYSKVFDWTFENYLARPQISQREGQSIVWQAVENAQYYDVYYKDGGEYKKSTVINCAFDYSSLAGGEKEFYVLALSNAKGYKTSPQSNVLPISHVYNLQEITWGSFDSTSFVLSFRTQEKISYIKLYIDEEETIVKLGDPQNIASIYQYSVNIASTNYEDGKTIGIAPYPENELSTFVGEIYYV